MDIVNFETLLKNLESDDPIRRLSAVIALENFTEPRALKLAAILTDDPDPRVSGRARSVYNILLAKGIEPKAERKQKAFEDCWMLNDARSVTDEVFTIVGRNAGKIFKFALFAGTLKIVLALVLLLVKIEPHTSVTELASILIPLHLLFMRPTAWLCLFLPITEGLFEKQLSKAPFELNSLSLKQRLFWINLISSLIPIAALLSALTGSKGVLVWWFLPVCISAILTAFFIPIQILENRSVTGTISRAVKLTIAIAREFLSSLPLFLASIAFLYSGIIYSLYKFESLFDGIGYSQSSTLASFFLIADVLMEPFCIAFIILFTHLAINKTREHK